jgi:CO/xanthine dehydrogenase Mo-binding subunit
MDELARELKMDPLKLWLLNYTEIDPHTKKPFTGKGLRQCYQQAADRFEWTQGNHRLARCATALNLSVGAILRGEHQESSKLN